MGLAAIFRIRAAQIVAEMRAVLVLAAHPEVARRQGFQG